MESAIGKIIFINGKQSRIEVLFYSKNGYWSNSELKNHFPTIGRVFAPNLGSDFPNIAEHDIVRFSYSENSHESDLPDGKDLYVLPSKKDGGKIWVCPRVLEFNQDKIFNRTQISDKKEHVFFFRKQGSTQCICGPVWSTNSEPCKGKEVKGWSYRPNYDTVLFEGTTYLVEDFSEFSSKGHKLEVDCMSASQLKEWFKGKLNNLLSPDELKKIQAGIKDVETVKDDEVLSKERFVRVKHCLSSFAFDWNEIQNFQALPVFKSVIDEAVKKNIDIVLSKEKASVEAKRAGVAEEKKALEDELSKFKKRHEAEKEEVKKELTKLKGQIKEKNEELGKLEEKYQNLVNRREELIESIKIQVGIAGNVQAPVNRVESFPIEIIRKKPNAEMVNAKNRTEFMKSVNNLLDLPCDFMNQVLLKNLSYERCFLTSDIRTGVFLASVLGNSIYQLCQPSPKWITFKDFWEESLQSIWESAHDNLDIWHFLLIENFNIALPECWGKPLWNVFDHKTKLIPYASNPQYPDNLRVIVSSAATESEDNSHLGLLTHIAKSWKAINIYDEWNKEGLWETFDDIQDVGINEDYFFPAG
ncbi:MAG: hypothetical protein WC071_00080 [Victivallaceae bacterium]